MDSVNAKGQPKKMNKKLVQDRFNGLKQNAQGEYEPIDDDMRVKILIGSETIQEGMNLQFRSSVDLPMYNRILTYCSNSIRRSCMEARKPV